MIIFLYGPDDYRREQKKRFYVEEFQKKYSGLSVGRFDLEEPDGLDRLRVFLRGSSLFEAKKLAAVSALYEANEKEIVELFSSVEDENKTVILCSEKEKPPKSLAVYLKKSAKSEEFPNLAGAEWEAFVRGSAGKMDLVLEVEAVEFLGKVYRNQSWGLVTELEKIANLPRKKVGRAELEALGLETLPDYWATVNGLRGGRLESRLWALEKLLAQKEPAAKIFNILSSLWGEKLAQAASEDFKVKSGKLEYEEALLDLVV